ncbi:Multidrug resistance protein MdtL [Paraburkholderia aspalathi]|uniref:MFS transporter n=1 Tax=Paraburkholderia aspalathi TaxID=1324617 RepID=UPI00190B3223|nr:MFS transporter [Paraburkholderia aspalathi]MBK3838999.1 MFS transporter [Paraburkholderia aspalathi]CAE6744670.1 Multidrug resistance protein MdtL [Paraburkholderia aspalathi]
MSNTFSSVSLGRSVAILTAVCLAALALPLSFSAGALATPAIGRELAGSPVEMNWITNAFMLTFGSLLMAAGTLADRFGRKRLFSIGVSGFTLVSLLLGLAPSILVVDLLRAMQGVAAAAALAGGTAALAQEFDGRARTRAFSLLGTTFGLGLALGPVLAGFMIERFGWRAIFATGAIAGVLSLLFGVLQMRESRDPDARHIDWAGIATFTGALSCFTFGVIQSSESGWSNPLVVGSLLGAALLSAAFWVIETRVARPMLDLSLFRYPRFVGVQVLPIATCYCYIVLLVVLPLRFVGADGCSEIDAGWLMLALSAPMLVVPFLAATLTRWMSAGVISGIGLLIAAAGLYWLTHVFHDGASNVAVAPLLTIGVGAGMPWGLMDGLSVSVVPKERAGMATGIFSTTRVAGECIALATVSAILAAITQARVLATLGSHARSAEVSEAAARLAAGDLDRASALLPDVARATLLHIYTDAFGLVLGGLTAVTLLCAIAVFVILGRARADDDASADLERRVVVLTNADLP